MHTNCMLCGSSILRGCFLNSKALPKAQHCCFLRRRKHLPKYLEGFGWRPLLWISIWKKRMHSGERSHILPNGKRNIFLKSAGWYLICDRSRETIMILLMEEILHLLIGSFSHYLQGFIHPRWCRILNSITTNPSFKQVFFTNEGIRYPMSKSPSMSCQASGPRGQGTQFFKTIWAEWVVQN